MIAKKPAPDLIRGECRFSDQIMLEKSAGYFLLPSVLVGELPLYCDL